MNILWAVIFVTEAVGLVITNQTSDLEVSNSWVRPPFMDADFDITFESSVDTYIYQAVVFDNIIAALSKLCNTRYTARIGSQEFFHPGREASIIELKADHIGGRLLTVRYTMWAIYWCLFELKSRPQSDGRYKEAQCIFGLDTPEGGLPVGELEFVFPRGGMPSSSGSSMPDTHVDVTRRIKQRGKAASAVAASLNTTTPGQSPSLLEAFDPANATTNTSGVQELSSIGNLTSQTKYSFQFRGDGPEIPLDQLVFSVLEALIDRASQNRLGPIYARNYRSVNGDYDVSYRPSTLQGAPELSYATVIICYSRLMALALTTPLREGDFKFLVNRREVLVGRFTRKAGANNVGIAAQ